MNNDIDEIGEMLTKLEGEVENADKNCCNTSVDNIQINSGRASETQSLPNMNVFLASRVGSIFYTYNSTFEHFCSFQSFQLNQIIPCQVS